MEGSRIEWADEKEATFAQKKFLEATKRKFLVYLTDGF